MTLLSSLFVVWSQHDPKMSGWWKAMEISPHNYRNFTLVALLASSRRNL